MEVLVDENENVVVVDVKILKEEEDSKHGKLVKLEKKKSNDNCFISRCFKRK